MVDNTVLLGLVDAGRAGGARLLRLRADRLPRARARRRCSTARRSAATPSIQIWWLVVTTGDRPVPRRLRDRSGCSPTAPAAARARTRSPPRPAPGHAAPGPGDRPAVAVHLPLSRLRRRRDAATSSCRPTRLIEFHVTSLDVIHSFWAYQLGVKADANPGRRQHRLRHDQGPADLQHPLRRAVRRLARLHVRHRPRRAQGRSSRPGSRSSSVQFAPATKSLPPYSKTYFPDPQRRGG